MIVDITVQGCHKYRSKQKQKTSDILEAAYLI